jgi:hypothetical protein
MTTDANRIMVLLFEMGSAGSELGRWLGENGFIAWRANDVNHAIEELSDFTVRLRPDVVLLEVPSFAAAVSITAAECALRFVG